MNNFCVENKKYSTFNENIPNITNNIASVSFAPFLMWNNHENDYFNKIGEVNKLSINTNKIDKCIKENNDEDLQDTELLLRNNFYSEENIKYIQKRIIIKVYEDSNKNYRLKPQKYEIIIQIMNGIYETYCRHLPYNIKEQIEELNEKIIDYTSKILLEETKSYYNYLRDIEPNKLNILDRPEFNSSRKVLPSYKY